MGPLATIDCEPRQARKGAAVAIDAGAGVWLLELPPNLRVPLMSYIALARKWRPRTFSQLVGQEHINKALINSLNQQRLHHAYLFTGTRGVGKTSIARLLAKALNCEKGISANPCLQCDACLSIEQGRFIDLIEIDGASRTRIEDTRELLDNIPYAPTNGRFKIYLIDEVHMLSQHSFNALLKTLEEPPEHVKFLLATTDPQKLPITVLSRCLQFNLKHLQANVICQHLEHILQDEHLVFEKPALELLAKAARGSMRDALSLLDQVIASQENGLRVQDVKNCLGYTQQDYALQLIQALAAPDPQRLIALSKQIAIEGGHFHFVLEEILQYLHQISMGQSLPNDSPFLALAPEIRALCTEISPEDVQVLYQIGINAMENIHLAPTLSIGFEMMLLRMYTFRPAPRATPKRNHQEIHFPADKTQQDTPLITEETRLLTPVDTQVNQSKQPDANVAVDDPRPLDTIMANHNQKNDWSTILPQLKLTGISLNAAENAELISHSDNEVVLRVSKGHQSLFTPTVISRIEQGLTNYYKKMVKLAIRSDEVVSTTPAQKRQNAQKKGRELAESALQNDPFFQQLQQEFSAEIVKNSISLIDEDLTTT